LQTKRLKPQGLGEEVVVVFVEDELVPGDELVFEVLFVVLELDEVPPDGSLSLTIVVSFFSEVEGGLVTVVSFCSQATSRVAPAKMQIILFIVRL
jgi:hypothetical protein